MAQKVAGPHYDHYELPQDVPNSSPQRRNIHESPRRQGYLMPLPSQSPIPSSSGHHSRSSSDNLVDCIQQCTLVDPLEIGIPVDEIDERRIQEEKDMVRTWTVIILFICLDIFFTPTVKKFPYLMLWLCYKDLFLFIFSAFFLSSRVH